MPRDVEEKGMFLALRVPGGGCAPTEIFLASAPGMTYKGLPVCTLAHGESIATEIEAAVAVVWGGEASQSAIKAAIHKANLFLAKNGGRSISQVDGRIVLF